MVVAAAVVAVAAVEVAVVVVTVVVAAAAAVVAIEPHSEEQLGHLRHPVAAYSLVVWLGLVVQTCSIAAVAVVAVVAVVVGDELAMWLVDQTWASHLLQRPRRP